MKSTFLKSIFILVIFPVCNTYAQVKNEWKTYQLFSMQLSLPSIFKAGVKNEFNTYTFPNTISKNISVNVECLVASTDFKASPLNSYHDDYLHEFEIIKKDVINDSVFVLSGVDKSGKTLFIKGVIKDNSYFGLTINYSPKYQYLFDKDLSEISDSFR